MPNSRCVHLAVLPLYAIVAAIWSPLFLEFWKRKNTAISFLTDMARSCRAPTRLPFCILNLSPCVTLWQDDFEDEERELDAYIERQLQAEGAHFQYGFYELEGEWVRVCVLVCSACY